MTNEEKEARHLINVLEDKKFTAQGEALRTYIEELNKNINKLQEENEELKENNLYYRQELEKAWKENEKLKDRIEYLGNEKHALYQDNISLLKEKYGTESLYYKYIEIPPVEVEGYISKDKIRDKIKELEELFDKNEKEITIQYQNQFIVDVVGVLEELLGDDEA